MASRFCRALSRWARPLPDWRRPAAGGCPVRRAWRSAGRCWPPWPAGWSSPSPSPVGAWPLAPLGPALLVLALQGRSLRASFAVGLLFGLALFVPLLSWLINLAWYAWAALAIAEAVIFALLAVGQRLLLSLRAWPVAVAGWWVAAEALRDRWPYAFPWGRLAMSQAGAPTAPWTAIGGAPLLSFLLALAGSTFAWLLLAPGARAGCAAAWSPRWPSPGRRGWPWRAACCRWTRCRPAPRPPRSPPSRATCRTPGTCLTCSGPPP